ncbi:hypothetical protein [Leptospira bandrabouensis]|uniref:hypothetical protein n=1 Tax=Leptospira bandrabouensis TaxID=2484903 RepID=UPI001090E23F|nr:hypothetical protein [Leptospira bandrabouensis]TGN08621.1 hypothetical protein EHR07_03640 [Leptospira bandrabouensis]
MIFELQKKRDHIETLIHTTQSTNNFEILKNRMNDIDEEIRKLRCEEEMKMEDVLVTAEKVSPVSYLKVLRGGKT